MKLKAYLASIAIMVSTTQVSMVYSQNQTTVTTQKIEKIPDDLSKYKDIDYSDVYFIIQNRTPVAVALETMKLQENFSSFDKRFVEILSQIEKAEESGNKKLIAKKLRELDKIYYSEGLANFEDSLEKLNELMNKELAKNKEHSKGILDWVDGYVFKKHVEKTKKYSMFERFEMILGYLNERYSMSNNSYKSIKESISSKLK